MRAIASRTASAPCPASAGPFVLLAGLRSVALHRREVQQHREPCRALDEGADRGTTQPEDQVSFPMAGHGPVVRLGRALADEDLVGDERLAPALRACARHPQCPAGPQACGQLALQRTPALHVERLVDRLVADAHAPVIRVVEPQTLSDLLRAPRPRPASALPRPVPAPLPRHGRPGHRGAARSDDGPGEPFPHIGPQRRTRRELRPLRTTRCPLRVPLRGGRPVIQVAAPRRRVAPQLARDRRCRPSRTTCDLPHAETSRPPQRDLLPLGERQVPPRGRLRRAGQMRRCHPTRLSEPAGSERLRYPNLHRRVLARQTLGDERPEPTPMLLPRHRRPPWRPQLSP